MRNPLDNMTWPERFAAATAALLAMEMRALDAERDTARLLTLLTRQAFVPALGVIENVLQEYERTNATKNNAAATRLRKQSGYALRKRLPKPLDTTT